MRKIRTQFIFSWGITFFLLVCLFISQIIQLGKFNRDHEIWITINQKLVRLSSDARKFTSLMENAIFNSDENNFSLLSQTAGEFRGTLESVKDYISEPDEILFLHRTTNNMLENMLESIRKADYENRYNFYYDPWIGIRLQGEFFIVQTDKLVLAMLERNIVFTFRNFIESNKRSLFIIVSLACLVLIILFLSSINNRRMYNDMVAVNGYAKNLLEGNLNIADISKSKYIEINNIEHTLDELKHTSLEKKELELHYNEEKIKNLEKDLLIREAKFQALQMQINPHFLFNTLNMINRSVLLENQATTIELIEAIATIMRYSMKKDKMDVFQNELESVLAYIKIQNIRFQDTIDLVLKMETSEDLGKVQLPPLIIQPIVENAIIHGVSNVSYSGHIEICVSTKEGYVVITVTDNGRGMAESQLDELRRKIESVGDLTMPGLGLLNVAQRLRLFFNMQDLFFIQSEIDKGTKVTIRIPRGSKPVNENSHS